MARHADIVVPSTTSLERNDLSCTRNDPLLVAMQQVVPPYAERARRLRHVCRSWLQRSDSGSSSPRAAIVAGVARAPLRAVAAVRRCRRRHRTDVRRFLAARARAGCEPRTTSCCSATSATTPRSSALATPSGRDRDLLRRRSTAFGYDDCAGHPRWYEPDEWLGGPTGHAVPAAPDRQPAEDAPAQPTRSRRARARHRRSRAANRSACTRTTPPTRGLAGRRRRPRLQRPRRVPGRCHRRRRTSGAAWSSCRPAPGTTRSIPPTPIRCACTATPTC